MQTQTEEIPFSPDFFPFENVYNEITESISASPWNILGVAGASLDLVGIATLLSSYK